MTLPPGPAPISSQPSTPAPSVPASIPASPIAAGIDLDFLQRYALELARRIVAEIDEPLQLAISMGLTAQQWGVLQYHPRFIQLLAEAKAEMNSAAGLADRLRLKAMMILDSGGLLDMAAVMSDTNATGTARVQAFNGLVDVAGISKQKDQQVAQAGSGPLVNIIMPSDSGAPVRIVSPTTIEVTP